MTDDYKELLLQFITGSLMGTPSSTDEVVMQQKVDSWDLYNEIPEADSDTIKINGIIKGSNNYALYGEYENTSVSAPYLECGFIIILDNNFNILQTLTQYDSGTYFRAFSKLKEAEDNTYYGVDIAGTYTPRFIMLNNFTIPNGAGNYVVKLRTSYNFDDSDFYTSGITIFKNPNSAHYIFVGMSNGSLTLKAIELKVNVGEANEWTSYTYNVDYMDNAYVNFDNEDRAYIETITNSGGYIKRIYKNYTSSTFTSYNVVASVDDEYIDSVAYINSSNFYYIYDRTIKNVGGSTIAINQTIPTYTGKLIMYNGDLYITYSYNSAFYYQRYEGTWKPIPIISSYTGTTFIFSEYNMLKVISVNDSGYTIITEDYNPNNYNSLPYVDTTAIFPQKARLYTSGDLTFARNDYNITALGNTFTTTVEVPNVYLNGDTINPSQLISKTNQVIVNYTDNLTKNVYERVYLNFVNSINAYDEDTGNVFDTTDLVKNISGLGYEYSDMCITKALYLDNTDQIVSENPYLASRYSGGERLSGYWLFPFTKTSEIYKIAFANNQNQIYGWIDVSNLEDGSWWVQQRIRLANIPVGEQNVLYNDNQVQYNGNDVIYRTSI